MKQMHIRHTLIAVGVFLALTVMGLWSWNTLADLFGGPQAQYKHALAAVVLLATLRIALVRRHSRAQPRARESFSNRGHLT